jgi:hypothetical protein
MTQSAGVVFLAKLTLAAALNVIEHKKIQQSPYDPNV